MICTLGDLLLDVIVRAPQPLAAGADTPVETRVVSGGQAANVAAWVVELGAAGPLRREAGRRRDRASWRGRCSSGAGSSSPGRAATGGRGVVVSFVGADGERSMATDRGVSPDLRADELDAALVRRLRVAPPLRLQPAGGADRPRGARGGRAARAPGAHA